MKKTIISVILTLTAICSLESCRESESGQMDELNIDIQKVEKQNKSMFIKSGIDSTSASGFSDYSNDDDPPPKDRGQWKATYPRH
ncbi:hypothetical protein LZQ00_08340 [Sphingobacterium sp. SRCM116780]|uniref:hypothetical protein n=1 Tax=Sphingobacterium sp. SRCM116780 TaxID=2907623 RepID=UPI001F243C82|nr:hypothetical protein [Sphingobacterium sp. SRCM116780]UIR57816.1 hypothetical protein LZQ00_08340 [Sphingobacterium sp. SRCM116780]